MNDPLFLDHKPIQNKIKKYDPLSIIEFAISYLKMIDQNGLIENQNYSTPWNNLLLIRWTYQYTAYKKKRIPEHQFRALLNNISSIESKSTMLIESDESIFADRLIRNASHRQIIPYQLNHDAKIKSTYARQIILFCNDNLKNIFQEATGLDVSKFLDIYLCYIALSKTNPQHSNFNINNLIEIFKKAFSLSCSQTEISNFLSLLSLDIVSAKKFIQDATSKLSTIDFQLYECTPLQYKPIFLNHGCYIPYCTQILKENFKNNLYDKFKHELETMNFLSGHGIFGKVFEKYILQGLKYLGDDFKTENEIKDIIGKKKKSVDFCIKHKDSIVLIDAKATELNHISKVNQHPSAIQQHVKNQIEKAFLQILSTLYHLKENGEIKDEYKIYGLIITYKEYAFGSITDKINQEIYDNLIETLTANNMENIIDFISLDNIFVIPIEDFDWLIGGIKNTNNTIIDVLEKVQNFYQDPKEKCFLFEQYLCKIFKEYHAPQYLYDIYNKSPIAIKEK